MDNDMMWDFSWGKKIPYGQTGQATPVGKMWQALVNLHLYTCTSGQLLHLFDPYVVWIYDPYGPSLNPQLQTS